MPQQTTPIFGANSTKQFIVEILSDEWPLSARAIYSKLTKKYQISVTYQAVHKALKEMFAQNIIIKDTNGYKISIDWIKQINKFGEKIKNEYENPLKPKLAFEYCFNSLFEAYMFFLSELEKNVQQIIDTEGAVPPEKNIACFHGIHMWNCLPARSEEEARLKFVTDRTKIYALGKASYKFDEIMKKYWESFGIKVKIGFDCTSNFEIVLIGDKMYYLHFPQELLENMESTYSKISGISDLDIAQLYKNVIYKNCKIYVIANKNKSVADTIRNWTIKQFE